MIDTDKYEGLSRFDLVEQHNIHELAIFLLDLLAEVKRLRGLLDAANERARVAIESHPNADEMLKELIE